VRRLCALAGIDILEPFIVRGGKVAIGRDLPKWANAAKHSPYVTVRDLERAERLSSASTSHGIAAGEDHTHRWRAPGDGERDAFHPRHDAAGVRDEDVDAVGGRPRSVGFVG
jgi:hypothetical protein